MSRKYNKGGEEMYVKAIYHKNIAKCDLEFEEMLASNPQYTVYQVGRIVGAIPSCASLDCAPLEKTLCTMKYGDVIAIVEPIDEQGNVIDATHGFKNVLGGISSPRQRVLETFDLTNKDDVDRLFNLAASQNVKFQDALGHIWGNSAGDYIRKKLQESYM